MDLLFLMAVFFSNLTRSIYTLFYEKVFENVSITGPKQQTLYICHF